MELYLFNPENDLALANNDIHFIPPRSARTMAADLSMLPAWWAGDEAAVWVDDVRAAEALRRASYGCCPQVHWLHQPAVAEAYRATGRILPLAAQWASGENTPPLLPSDAVTSVVPWGWSLQLVGRLRALGVREAVLPDAATMAEWRCLSGRQLAADVLREVRGRAGGIQSFLLGEAFVCTDESSLVGRMEEGHPTLLKAPWSGSGKGLRLGQAVYGGHLAGWCRRLLREQGAVMVEPLYDKVMDFAMEFYADGAGNMIFQGLSLFDNTRQGAYSGNVLCSESRKREQLRAFVPEAVLDGVCATVQTVLEERLGRAYKGCLGVDMMVCCTSDGSGFRVHPCVEVNLRMTMGMVALHLSRLLAPDVTGRFTVRYEAAEGALLRQHEAMTDRCPRRVQGGRITGGFWPLTPVNRCTQYAAELTVSE